MGRGLIAALPRLHNWIGEAPDNGGSEEGRERGMEREGKRKAEKDKPHFTPSLPSPNPKSRNRP